MKNTVRNYINDYYGNRTFTLEDWAEMKRNFNVHTKTMNELEVAADRIMSGLDVFIEQDNIIKSLHIQKRPTSVKKYPWIKRNYDDSEDTDFDGESFLKLLNEEDD